LDRLESQGASVEVHLSIREATQAVEDARAPLRNRQLEDALEGVSDAGFRLQWMANPGR